MSRTSGNNDTYLKGVLGDIYNGPTLALTFWWQVPTGEAFPSYRFALGLSPNNSGTANIGLELLPDGDPRLRLNTDGIDSSTSEMRDDRNFTAGSWHMWYCYWTSSTQYGHSSDNGTVVTPALEVGDWSTSGPGTNDTFNVFAQGAGGNKLLTPVIASCCGIWDRALTAGEITSLYAKTHPRTVSDNAGDDPLTHLFLDPDLIVGSGSGKEEYTCPISSVTLTEPEQPSVFNSDEPGIASYGTSDSIPPKANPLNAGFGGGYTYV